MGETTGNRISVTHFGPYPPTYGGVSVHIRRLHCRLRRQGVASQVIAPPELPAFPEEGVRVAQQVRRRYHWLLYPGIPVGRGIVHCHEDWMRMSWVLCRLRLQGHAVVLTVHDQQDARRWEAAGPDRRLGARFFARMPGVRWIAVSETVRKQLVSRGVSAGKIQVIPAFLAPSKEDASTGDLPASFLSFVQSRNPVLSIYGSKYDFVQGVDLYGFDMALDAVAELKSRHPNIGLVVCVPGTVHMDYQSELVRRATQAGCLDHVLFLNEGVQDGSELWRRGCLHLRPTVTDGDSVAVREALALGVGVVASDATARPPGCVLFPSRNAAAFRQAIEKSLESPIPPAREIEAASETHYQSILGQYEKLLANGPERLK